MKAIPPPLPSPPTLPSTPLPPPDASTHEQLAELQRLTASLLFSPLNTRWGMQRRTKDGRSMKVMVASFIKPNERLTAFERLEIYNRQYWFRLLDCLYDDYPGVREIVGERLFMKLAREYLLRYPSCSYSLRDLGNRLEHFLGEIAQEPEWTTRRPDLLAMARDMARFEWAQIVAFDGASEPIITQNELLSTPPSELTLGLQPYLSLLKLSYAVDTFSTALKRDDALRSEASQAVDAPPTQGGKKRRRRGFPKREIVSLAVHRCDNQIYFKRLEPEAFKILIGLERGLTLEEACTVAITESDQQQSDWAGAIREWFSCWASLGWLTARK